MKFKLPFSSKIHTNLSDCCQKDQRGLNPHLVSVRHYLVNDVFHLSKFVGFFHVDFAQKPEQSKGDMLLHFGWIPHQELLNLLHDPKKNNNSQPIF